MELSRPRLLLALVAVAALGNVIWYIAGDWGTVTIHATKRPLAEVAASIARQGHIRLRTNLDPATLITLNFDKVPVTDAVDRLAIVVDGRWRLAYLVGPRKAEFAPLLDGWASSKPDPSWRWIDHPLRGLGFDDSADGPPDPRVGKIVFTNAALPPPLPPADPAANGSNGSDSGTPAPAPSPADLAPLAALQPLLEKAALFADVQVAVPTDWNPPVSDFGAKAEAPSLFAKLASAARGSSEEVFLLSVRTRRGPRPETADDDTPPPIRNRLNPAAVDAALQGYVDRLPAGQRADAQAQLDDRRKQWQAMQGLTPEQRRARWQAMMNNPNMQELMQDRQLDREAKMTPEQRDARMSNMVAAKAAATGR